MKPVSLSRARKRMFLEAIAEYGNIHAASRVTGIPRSIHYDLMKRDPEYAKAFHEATDVAIEAMEAEARRRAVEGITKDVYQGGRRVGEVREYSDTLLMFLLKAVRPDRYRERVDLTVDIRREAERIAAAAGLETDAVIAEAERLIAEARAAG